MAAGVLPLIIDQGEDWTAQLVVTDDNDEPINIISPCRMDIKDKTGATIITLDDTAPEDPTSGYIPAITVSSSIGMVQLHIESTATAAMPAGQYGYDLFVTVDDGNVYAGNQIMRLVGGFVTVNKRITVMTA